MSPGARRGLAALVLAIASGACGARSGLLEIEIETARVGDAAAALRDASPDRRARPPILDPRCPPTLPLRDVRSCAPDGLRCNYERCLTEGKDDHTVICRTSSWFYDNYWPCAANPPGCPGSPPEHGSRCSDPQMYCRWAIGSKAVCTQSAGWVVWTPDGLPP